MLGDGHLEMSKRGKNACVRITRMFSDHSYNTWLAKEFSEYNPVVIDDDYWDKRTNKTYQRSRLRLKCDDSFTIFWHKWYTNRVKHIPDDIKITPLSLAIWFADDGSISKIGPRQLGIKFATHSFNENEVIRLQTLINALTGSCVKIYPDNNHFILHGSTKSALAVAAVIDSHCPLTRKAVVWRPLNQWERETLPPCKWCKSTFVSKFGFDAQKKQKYKCKICRKVFRDRYTRKQDEKI